MDRFGRAEPALGLGTTHRFEDGFEATPVTDVSTLRLIAQDLDLDVPAWEYLLNEGAQVSVLVDPDGLDSALLLFQNGRLSMALGVGGKVVVGEALEHAFDLEAGVTTPEVPLLEAGPKIIDLDEIISRRERVR